MSKQTYPVLPLRNMVIMPQAVVPVGVGREKSVSIIEAAREDDIEYIVTVAQRDDTVEEPGKDDLYDVGTKVRLLKVIHHEDSYTAIVEGEQRVRVTGLRETEEGYLAAEAEPLEEEAGEGEEAEKLVKKLVDLTTSVVRDMHGAVGFPTQGFQKNPAALTDIIAAHAPMTTPERQELLEELRVAERVRKCVELLQKHFEISQVSREIQEKVQAEAEKTQRDFFLRQQMKAIQEQLGDENDELGELGDRIAATPMTEEARAVVEKQFRRLRTMPQSSSEYNVITNYIDTILEIPWFEYTEDDLDLKKAQGVLDEDHYGLRRVKERVLEYLAVLSLKDDLRGPIICLHGPPGVGKTSISRSVAETLGREFQRISLGGVHDESEIRGHRRTYVGAMPGRIARAMTKAGTMNPVILLDEIDKLGSGLRGDPSAALLEVLDPEQNHAFNDHYLDMDLDLSDVLFIATANDLGSIPAPLRDRMEVIEVPSYTLYEKQQIAERHLLPKQVAEHGLQESHVQIPTEAITSIIEGYTREAGVRTLERRVAGICRKVAVQVASAEEAARSGITVKVDSAFISEALGPVMYMPEVALRQNRVGVATGLAWTQTGGDVLFIEVQKMKGTGEVKLTGQLGDVMKESFHAALSYIRSQAVRLGVSEVLGEEKIDLHLHVPAGAIPKDGPSAGITIFSALLSRLKGVSVRNDVAMTGELTLSGDVLPVGGIREKVIAAHRAGIKEIILPEMNKKDLIEVEEDVLDELTIHFVKDVSELPSLVFEE